MSDLPPPPPPPPPGPYGAPPPPAPGGGGRPGELLDRFLAQQALLRSSFQALGLISIVPIVGAFLGTVASLAAVIFIAVTINNDTVARQGWHDHFAGGTKVLKIG